MTDEFEKSEIELIEKEFEDTRKNIEEDAKKWKEGELNISEWIDKALEVKRIQSYTDGKWETTDFKLLLSSGGPTTWLSTDGTLEVYWGGKSKIGNIENGIIRDFLDAVFDYLHESEGI
ncbi:MAG: hypothetical protein QW734_03720 [Candidatus Bathyarchaeia archaeon]